MNTVPIAVGVVGGFALVWLVKAIFTTIQAIVNLVEKLLTFPQVYVHDQ